MRSGGRADPAGPAQQDGVIVVPAAEEWTQLLAGKGRVVLRYSGTEPKARLLLEGPKATQLKHLADAIEHALKQELGA